MSGKCLLVLEGSEGWVHSLIYSADGKQLVCAYGKVVRIWDIKNGNCLLLLKGHKKWVRSLCYSLDRKQIASGSEDKTVQI
uniref:WD40 repeat domain-containing protein n=1 Tax=Candidatus Uabimicrobium helgolandensis TaxID=3095367 RepID=UPI003FD8E853